jgi:hypothetical protein
MYSPDRCGWKSVLQDDIHHRTVDLDPAVLQGLSLEESALAEAVHEAVDGCASQPAHVREHVPGDDRQRMPWQLVLVEVREQQQCAASRFSLRLKIWLTISASMRAFRASICDRSQSDRATSWGSRRRISGVAILTMLQDVIASALDLRRRWPARAPSPNSAPA